MKILHEDDEWAPPPGAVFFPYDELDSIFDKFTYNISVPAGSVMAHVSWCLENIGQNAITCKMASSAEYAFDPKYKWSWFPGRGFFFMELTDATAFKLIFGKGE